MGSMQHANFANFILSEDGYIRLSLASFLDLPFDERIAWLDEDLRLELSLESNAAIRAGYCEWACGKAPIRVSVGWTWLETTLEDVIVVPGGISSNIMLVDSQGCDFGVRKTESLIRAWLSFLKWRAGQIASSFEAARQLHLASLSEDPAEHIYPKKG